ncbi:uncharacterized protein EI90DRAFT_3052630 [Cantharellus anzutake]|uniref:uncharacterized protein n=1 Tax=Cantharellus anzutake TaxID=1750568 RepID=UPI0019071E94|nr:uncharacterized protein EI90DRAFT_3104408 [Cantharellus anzutake]XP_038917644.1 uncharacterized protein EI90DRAFT_3052630 [Cantharellus anzutake]KAF8309698.1 hypothetical protein EI90DRAFT_3104408 [Cantharellus anzutake]KAF8333639.1 hypothetical protein EI90DRAFT_3052630 [Cantharellus anzutake]
MNTNREELSKLLKAAETLTGPADGQEKAQAKDMADVLGRRLEAACVVLSNDFTVASSDKLVLQKATADYALCLLERIQGLLDVDQGIGAAPPLIGTRDMGLIRMLLSIVFKWGVEQQLVQLWKSEPRDPASGSPPSAQQPMEIDPTNHRVDLNKAATRIYELVFRNKAPIKAEPSLANGVGHQSNSLRQTHITQVLLTRHATDMLRPAIYLGWHDGTQTATVDSGVAVQMTTYTRRLLNMLPAAQTIASLGGIMSPPPSFPSPPASLLKGCSNLLTQQLLRPDGVIGLFSAVLGDVEEGVNDAPLARLEHIAQILSTPPKVLSKAAYFRTIIPRLLPLLLSPDNANNDGSTPVQNPSEAQIKVIPRPFIRGAAFALARILTRPSTAEAASNLLLSCVHSPFLPKPSPSLATSSDSDSLPPFKTVHSSIRFLAAFILNTDPSPTLISFLITPVLVPLYYLTEFFDTHPRVVLKSPEVKEMTQGLIRTWARVISTLDARNGWWDVITGTGGWSSSPSSSTSHPEFSVDEEDQVWNEWAAIGGELVIQQRKSSLLPDVSKLLGKKGSSTAGPLEIRPNPVHFVSLLKGFDRKEVTGAIFIRTLDEYSALRQSSHLRRRAGGDSVRAMLCLSIVLEMIQQLDTSVISQTHHILGFISHALEPAAMDSMSRAGRGISRRKAEGSTDKARLTLDDLKIVHDESDFSDDDMDGGDSDDESDETIDDSRPLVKGGDDEMAFTAINLLLSLLEANPDLTPQTSPILLVIFHNLETLMDHLSPSIRKPALEARLVITTRSSIIPPPSPTSTTGSYRANSDGDEDPPGGRQGTVKEGPRTDQQSIYQEALRLIQDPILPVRAYGLTMLRQLIVPSVSSNAKPPYSNTLSAEHALIPAILSIFIEAVQDDDSFIFLHAVRGLAALGTVSGGVGKEVVRRLVSVYVGGLKVGRGGGEMSKREMDKRLRIGEALEQVVRRTGGALGGHSETIIPPLILVFRSTHAPTTLRTSALSVLALCADAAPDAILTWSGELTSALVDLLQVESVPTKLKQTEPPDPPALGSRHAPVGSSGAASATPSCPNRKKSLVTVPTNGKTTSLRSDGKSASSSTARHDYEDSVPPLTKSAKIPSFRRAALHFIALLIRTWLSRSYDSSSVNGASFSGPQGIGLETLSVPSKRDIPHAKGPSKSGDPMDEDTKRLNNVLRYVRMTDEDGLVRIQAGECVELLEDLVKYRLGMV